MPRHDPWNDPDWKAFASRVSEDLYPMLANSAMTVSIAPEEADVKFAVELGFSIMLDKPLVIVVPPGRTVPNRLRKIADAVVEGDFTDPEFSDQFKAVIDAIKTNG